MKRLFFVLAVLLFAQLVQAQLKAKWGLHVAFKPGMVNPPLQRHAQTQTPLTGISYIDSVNIANGANWVVQTGIPALPSTVGYYHVFFRDSVDVRALAQAYLANPNVVAASPDYYIRPHFTPNDPLFDTLTPSMRCRQWAFDSAHAQLEKAWDITKGDTNVLIAVVDIGIRYNHTDLQPKLWINTPEDINNPGTFEPWPSNQQIGTKWGDLDSIDQDGDGFIDDVIGYHFTGYDFYGDTCSICDNCRSCPDTLSPTDIPLDDRFPCDDDEDPCVRGGGGGCTGCRLYIRRVDSVVARSSPVVDSLGRVPVTLGSEIRPHGSWVSSVAAAATNNSQGAAGAAPNCRILSITAGSSQNGYWGETGNVMGVAFARKIAQAKNKKLVINMSWSIAAKDDSLSKFVLQHQLDSADAESIILVSSAGNKPTTPVEYPSWEPKVTTVAATDTSDRRHSFSKFHHSVDLSAPSEHWVAHPEPLAYLWRYTNASPMPSYCSSEGLGTSGTSFSSPFVAGIAALVKSVRMDFSPAEVRAKLRTSTDSIKHQPGNSVESTIVAGGKLGTGRINAFKAVTFFGNIPGELVNDTTLDGTVYVSGDIRVRAGKTLRIAAGTVLKFYPGDVMKGGVDIAREEIVVDSGGTLIVGDSLGSPVQFVSFKTTPGSQDWRGVVVKKGGSAKFYNTQFKHAYAGIDFQNSASDEVKGCLFENTYMYGIITKNSNLKILNSTFKDIQTGYGIYLDSCNATVSGNTVTNVPYGINAYKSYGTIASNIITTTGSYIANFGFRAEGAVPSPGTQKAYFDHDSVSGIFDEAAVVANGGVAIDAAKIWPKLPSPPLPDPMPQMIGILGLGTAVATVQNTTVKMFTSNSSTVPAIKVDGTPVLDLNDWCECPDPVPTNRIYRAGTSSKAVYNTTGTYVIAEKNWWGTSSPTSSFFQGLVDWQPAETIDPGPYWKIAAKEDKTPLPLIFSLGQNYPNPFNPTTTIRFSLPKAEKVKLKVYNILGQEVTTLLDGEKPAGAHQLIWDGKDGSGRSVSSGLYFYKLETISFREVKRMVFLK